MTIQPGTRLGPYEIVASIGAGGMGEVWRARDTRLDRDVAIKVLPAGFAENEQLLQRFEREAKAISQLNHPNVCTLFDVGKEEARGERRETSQDEDPSSLASRPSPLHYLVMEYLEGESLADRLKRGSLPLHEVLKYGQQIASALDAAHRQGITHRDLKPGNIMLTKSGAKLLDFGLAKTASESQSPIDGLTNLPTEAKPLTQEGTILGTFQYMAPEQLEGLEADARTDIFALGAVLHEMATGRRAFQGGSKTSLIAAIVQSQPAPISSVIAMAPPALDHVVRKCLEKDPDDRWQSAHDVSSELAWISEAGSQVGVPVSVVSSRRRREHLKNVGLALLTAAALLLGWLVVNAPEPAPSKEVAMRLVLPEGWATFNSPIVSPDGSKIAFAAGKHSETAIWIRSLNEEEARMVPGTEGVEMISAWSPSGNELAFVVDRKTKRVALDGGAPVTICSCAAYEGSWNEDGVIIHYSRFGEGLFRVDASGGEQVPLTRLDKEAVHKSPYFFPDGNHFAFLGRTGLGIQSDIFVASLDDPTPRRILAADDIRGILPGNVLLLIRQGRVVAQKIDLSTAKPIGSETTVIDRVEFNLDSVQGLVSASNGVIAWRPPILEMMTLRWRARDGSILGETGFTGPYGWPSLSPDSKRAVVMKFSDEGVGPDLWVLDLERRLETRLTSHPEIDLGGLFSPDGRSIVFQTARATGLYDLFIVGSDGAKPPEPFIVDQLPFDKFVSSFSPDGKFLLIGDAEPGLARNVYLIEVATKSVTPLVRTEFSEFPRAFSPDGAWLAYTSDQSGPSELYIQRIDGTGRRVQVSTEGAGSAFWIGNEILYWGGNALWSVHVQLQGDTATISTPIKLRESIEGVEGWDTADGQRFLTLERVNTRPDPAPIHVMVNWRLESGE